jgi:hypothetical protein
MIVAAPAVRQLVQIGLPEDDGARGAQLTEEWRVRGRTEMAVPALVA